MAGFRPEIQALRALAVAIVVLFHLWPERLPGGFVGVDVFFAISGYLITAHLLREISTTGTIRLGQFWARRIRRLLPAAAVVLALTLVSTLLFLPWRMWKESALQVAASAVGLQNWLLASNSTDYFGQNSTPTAVQHFWSLSLEEQFYVIWPLLLLGILVASRSFSPARRLWLVGIAMTAVLLLSFAWSVFSTHSNPTTAYFSTFTHAWEFALGGLLALLASKIEATRWSTMERTRAVATWIGLLAIGASAVLLTGDSGFPGWIASFPVLGALVVIAAGRSSSRIQHVLHLDVRPIQLLGVSSYSVYLWHWPLIIIVPSALNTQLSTPMKIGLLMASLLLGWLSKTFIEDRIRRSATLSARPWLNYALAVSVSVCLVASASFAAGRVEAQSLAAQQAAQEKIDEELGGGGSCLGAAAMLSEGPCPNSHLVDPLFGPDFAADDWGSLAGVNKDGTLPDRSACEDFSGNQAGFLDCALGEKDSDTTIAIIGDSHALALTEPLVRVAETRGWAVRALLMNSCTASTPMEYIDPTAKAECNRWRELMAERVMADPEIDIVITTGFTRGEPEAAYTGSQADLVQGYSALWQEWAAAGKRVFVIEDVPLTEGTSVPDCVAARITEMDPCAMSRENALVFDPVVSAVEQAASPEISLIDLTPAFCSEDLCHAVIGSVIAYRDPHHLSATFAKTLIPLLSQALPAAR